MSNSQFCFYTLGLILVWTVVIAVGSVAPRPVQQVFRLTESTGGTGGTGRKWKAFDDPSGSFVKKDERDCKSLCGNCGCMGFYCGEECICECNNAKADTECISTMLKNAKKLDIPYQLLIQGPSNSPLMRTALHFEKDKEKRTQPDFETNRNKRSTITIYNPAEKKQVYANRMRRASNSDGGDLDWFNDWTAALVRPAPIPGRRSKKIDENSDSAVQKRSPNIDLDRSWFSDSSSSSLHRPAPISKRQSSRKTNFDGLSNLADPISMVERIPKVIKNTLQSLREPEEQDSLWGSRQPKLANLFKNNNDNNQNEALNEMQRWRDNIVGAFEKFIEHGKQNAKRATTTTTTTSAPFEDNQGAGFFMPWLRPINIIRRMQNALQ